MVDSRAKGARVETDVKKKLIELTGLKWERVPGSGALDPKHQLKGDLYVVGEGNLFVTEVKGYKDDHLTSAILTSVNPQLLEFWEQAVRQGIQVNKKPLLIFKHDRSKIFAAFEDPPSNALLDYMYVNCLGWTFYIALLDKWVKLEDPKFIK
jgi:hypothetical protein